jgi:hypothetical protein
MKQIIIDYFWRKWWIIVPLLLAEIFVVRLSGSTMGLDVYAILLLAVFLGPVLLSYDLQRGFTRVLMTLPVTGRQIGRAWWLSTVGLPSLLLAAATVLSTIVPIEGGQTGLLFLNWLMQFLFLGFLFCLLSFLPGSYHGSWPERIRGGFFGTLWGLSFSGGFWLFHGFSWSHPLNAEIFMAATAVLTIVGWFRAERMVVQRGSFRLGAEVVRPRSAQYKAPAGFGGLPFLWQRLLLRLGWFGVGLVGWALGTIVLIGFMEGWSPESFRHFLKNMTPMLGMWSLIFVYLYLVLPTMTHLRFLRTLPISTSVLAGTIVLFPVGSVLIFGLVGTLLGGGARIWASCLMSVVAIALLVPFCLWKGSGKGTYLTLLGFVMVSAMSRVLFDSIQIPLMAAILVSLPIIAIAWEVTRRLLGSSSKAYHVRPWVPVGWGGGRCS